MTATVGIRELRQNLSQYIDRVKDGESLLVTERGREVARLVPSGPIGDDYSDLVARFGATMPTGRLEDIARSLPRREGAPAGTTDAHLAEMRRDRFG
jgi:prevent-host-death family protein